MRIFLNSLFIATIALTIYAVVDHLSKTADYTMDCAAYHVNKGEEYVNIEIHDYINVPIWASMNIETSTGDYSAVLSGGTFLLDKDETETAVFISENEDVDMKIKDFKRFKHLGFDGWRALAHIYTPKRQYEVFTLYCRSPSDLGETALEG